MKQKFIGATRKYKQVLCHISKIMFNQWVVSNGGFFVTDSGTRNVKDFEWMQGVGLVNPWERGAPAEKVKESTYEG
ncbi:hypothetical protein [Endothiovibrio diazotrophicus]